MFEAGENSRHGFQQHRPMASGMRVVDRVGAGEVVLTKNRIVREREH